MYTIVQLLCCMPEANLTPHPSSKATTFDATKNLGTSGVLPHSDIPASIGFSPWDLGKSQNVSHLKHSKRHRVIPLSAEVSVLTLKS